MQEDIPKTAMYSGRRPLLTIGHSNHPIGHLLGLLARHRVEVVADVRSVPYSRFAPQYRKAALASALTDAGIGYLFLGEQLGGKPPRGEAGASRLDYATRIREPAFRDGIAQLLTAVRQARVALLCRERDPIDCHRLHLICRYLAPQRLNIGHILPDGAIEPQSATERRLLARGDGRQPGLFDDADGAVLERAYARWWHSSEA